MNKEILETLTIIEEEENRTKRDIEIIKQAKQEIERLNKERETDIKYNKYLQKELAKANSIIKEVREYIEELAEDTEDYIGAIDRRRKVELLEILDKV